MSRRKKTKTEQNTESVAAEAGVIAPPQPPTVPAAGAGSRLNRLWRLYCARVTAIDFMHEMRGNTKAFRDAFNEATRALDVFEDCVAKEDAQ